MAVKTVLAELVPLTWIRNDGVTPAGTVNGVATVRSPGALPEVSVTVAEVIVTGHVNVLVALNVNR